MLKIRIRSLPGLIRRPLRRIIDRLNAAARLRALRSFAVLVNGNTETAAVLPINADGSLAPLRDPPSLPGKPASHRTGRVRLHPCDVHPGGRFMAAPGERRPVSIVFR